MVYEFVYDESDRVTSKTNQVSNYTYTYNDKERTIKCTEPNGNKTTFQYTKDYRIESETYSDGTIKYYYNEETAKKKDSGKEDTVTIQSTKTENKKNNEQKTTEEVKSAKTTQENYTKLNT